MKYIKKIIPILIAFTLMLNTIAYAESKTDLPNTDNIAVQTLIDLGILKLSDPSKLTADKAVNRAEFAVMLSGIMGFEEQAASSQSDTSFTDVPKSHKASGAVNMLVKLGVMDGYLDGRFDPDGSVTYQQAIKSVICALGYGVNAEQRGGYPTGYLTVAAEKGITKKITANSYDLVTMGQVAQMMYNMIDVDLMEKTGYGSETKYEISKDKTILTEKLDIYKEEGHVIANHITRLNGESSIGEDEVEIEREVSGRTLSELYKIGKTQASDFLGYPVTYYYKQEKDSDDKVLLHIRIDGNNSTVLKIKNDQIEKYEKGKYTYWEDEEKNSNAKTAKIASDAVVIYNGKAIPSIIDCLKEHEDKFGSDPANIFYPRTKDEGYVLGGNVTLIDSGNSDDYDVVIITAYENHLVHSVGAKSNMIFFKNESSGLELDPDNKDLDFSIKDKDGKKLEIGDISEWDILSVAKSVDETMIEVNVAREKVEGDITQIENGSGRNGRKVWIGDKEYMVAANFSLDDSNVNDTGKFYLDIEGKIAASDKIAFQGMLGYLVNVQMSRPGLDQRVQFKILTTEDKVVAYEGANKIAIDEQAFQEYNSEPNELLDPNMIVKTVKQQILRYSLDKEGKIAKIDTASIPSSTSSDTENNGLRLTYQFDTNYDKNASGFIFKTSNNILGGRIPLNEKTIIFEVPRDQNLIFDCKDSDYRAKTVKSLKGDKWYKNVSAYKVNDIGLIADAVIIPMDYAISSKTDGDDHITVVDRIVTSMDAQGNKVKKLYGYTNGILMEALTEEEDTTLDGLHKGDVIRYHLNDNKQIGRMRKPNATPTAEKINMYIKKLYVAGSTDNTIYPTNPNSMANWDNTDRYEYGWIYEKSANIVGVTMKPVSTAKAGDVMYYSVDSANVYIYDKSTDKVSLGKLDDVVDYVHGGAAKCSRVFVHGWKGECRAIVIYKE